MINFKIYEDGPRTILVFENTSVKVKEIIKNIISGIVGSQTVISTPVIDVAPIKIEETKAPNIAMIEKKDATTIIPIDVNRLIMDKGFVGYCEAYEYFATNKDQFTPEQSAAILSPIHLFTKRMRETNIDMVSDMELNSFIKTGSTFVFRNKIPQILQQSGFASLEDFLASGRQNLVDAYLALIA